MTTSRLLQRWLFLSGTVLTSLLLIRFTVDFARSASPILTIPFAVLVLAALALSWSYGFAQFKNAADNQRLSPGSSKNRKAFALLLVMMPMGIVASALDCTGFSIAGCTPICTLLKTTWLPVLILLGMVFWFSEEWYTLALLTASVLVFAVPHCVCYNFGNGWWIDRIGVSPVCYAWGMMVSLISIGGIATGRWILHAILINSAIISGATAFFVGHHYFKYPW